MFQRINEILEKKTVKLFLLSVSIIGFIICIILMQTQIENNILRIIERRILKRILDDPEKWKNYIFQFCYNFSVFFIIVWYFYLKRNFLASLCFLLAATGLYMYVYIIIKASHGEGSYSIYPAFILLLIILAHIVFYRRHIIQCYDKTAEIRQKIKYYLTENKFLNSSLFIFTSGVILGALFFINIFGTTVLDFTYTDWLMAGGDLSQHYMGWRLFRNSSWYFPIGLMDNIVYPFRLSIIYTDSIPLFAIIFKLMSPILPESFQYFGLFGLICYILQGGIGSLIIRKIGGNSILSIIGSLFFLLSTVLLQRIFGHTSLSAHFILLLCILMCLYNNISKKKQIILWSCLLALSASIHLYFVTMVIIFLFFYLLYSYFKEKRIMDQCIVLIVSLLVLYGTMFCLGAFYSVKSVDSYGFGFFSANLNTFINPQGTSGFIKDLPNATAGQYEGYAYIGLGMIIFVIISGKELIHGNLFKNTVKNTPQYFPYILGILLVFLLFSLSPAVTLNQYTLFTYPVIWPFKQIWSIFRSTGRMTWPIIYTIITFCIWCAVKQFTQKKALIIICLMLLVQWFDLRNWYMDKGNNFKEITVWHTELPSPVWNDLADDYEHILFTDEYKKIYSFLDLVANHNLTINDAYLARSNWEKVNENKEKEKDRLRREGPRDDMVYIFRDREQALSFKDSSKGVYFYRIDDIFIGINSKKDYLLGYEL